MKFRPFCSDHYKKVCTKIKPSADIHKGTVSYVQGGPYVSERFFKNRCCIEMSQATPTKISYAF